ncbi:lysyl oxidase homolog 3B [Lingula anatina]|uniref:Lysyl oxidase homolog 3B n=1 Tax=Lingula anatina TaxID=7574 RepID=A0A1S3GZ22_LINAN|nr:lysyl oxidase homolog 3B [Lingula anatina]|eukprot:XP_013379008.1 lysyl oxidase homolog 3B [Lingula anatina]
MHLSTIILLMFVIVTCRSQEAGNRRHNHGVPDVEGFRKIKLVGGRTPNEGNVMIYHDGEWGIICDDRWDKKNADVACRDLGYLKGAASVTKRNHFRKTSAKIWMDDVYCYGNEKQLEKCWSLGWGRHNCDRNEAAGVVCKGKRTEPTTTTTTTTTTTAKPFVYNDGGAAAALRVYDDAQAHVTPSFADNRENGSRSEYKVRLKGGRHRKEGRVEVRVDGKWKTVCGTYWSLLEAMVVCRQLGYGYADRAHRANYFQGQTMRKAFAGIECTGKENTLSECRHHSFLNHEGVKTRCSRPASIAGVSCTDQLPDIKLNLTALEMSVYLQDRPFLYMTCALEENCFPSDAYDYIERNPRTWSTHQRRLLRFTSDIHNHGTAPFNPHTPKTAWDWHACHLHYHSMLVFAHYDLIDTEGNNVAEGHKAGFCLEDVHCHNGSKKVYSCVNYGDQGISPGCSDVYDRDIDCQWIDISNVKPGNYILRIHINPEYMVAELDFDNNISTCDVVYTGFSASASNCRIGA